MKISAVILSYNSAGTLDKCLTDLLDALADLGGENEVFVVDNGSMDTSGDIIRRHQQLAPAVVKPIFFYENTGTTFSRNAALREAAGDYILVLDSDAYVNAAALSALMRFLDENPATGLAIPRLFWGSGKYQLSCDVFPTLLHKLRRFLFLRTMESRDDELATTVSPVDVDYAISACWLIRRDAFAKTGLFDEKIFYSPEDVDYCLRIWEAGFRISYVPEAHVVHDAQELSRGFRLSRFHFSHLWGLLYLQRKHNYFWGLRRLYARLGRFS